MTAPIALVASVALETEPVRRRLHDMREVTIGRKPAWEGMLASRPVLLMAGGMGKTNAAQAVTALAEAREIAGVVAFGVGGAYPGSDLSIGDVALASAEVYGDEGVAAPEGWISTEGIGIPLLDGGRGPRFNELPLPADRVRRAAATLVSAGVPFGVGPFVTVSCCSGTAARGLELRERFGAICESMEGAAAAHVALIYGLPFVELRGISNHVEDRDLAGWRLAEAAEAVAAAVERVVEEWD